MQMSYRRAWLLVDELNKLLAESSHHSRMSPAGGGTALTPVGEKTIALYHTIEARTRAANSGFSKIDTRLSARGPIDLAAKERERKAAETTAMRAIETVLRKLAKR